MANKILSAEEFLEAIKIRPEPFNVPGLGAVEVQSLTFDQMAYLRQTHPNDPGEQVIYAVANGMVSPKLSEEEVKVMRQSRPAAIAAISTKVFALTTPKQDDASAAA